MAEAAAAARADEGNSTTEEELKARLAATEGELATERAKRGTAESAAASERVNRFAAHEQAIASSIEVAKARLAEAKRGYATAMAESKFEEAAEFQEQISEAALDVRGLNWQKGQIEAAKKAPVVAAAPADPVERAIAGMSPEAQRWCRAHPDFVTDPKKNAQAHAAHHLAVAEGLAEWSAEYLDFVEGRLGLRRTPAARHADLPGKPAAEVVHGVDISGWDGDTDERGEGEGDGDGQDMSDQGERERSFASRGPADAGEARRADELARGNRRADPRPASAQPQPRERTASTAAPPSRGTPSGTGTQRGRTRQPTSGELEAAKISFPDEWKESPRKALATYFENQAALRREGRL
jgi:hypothetical protein